MTRRLLPGFVAAILLCAGRYSSPKHFAHDYAALHPSDAGHHTLSDFAFPVVERALRRR